MIEGIGLDNPDPSVACHDVSSMASFLGVEIHHPNFVSPPVTHKRVTLPLNEFGKVVGAGAEPLDDHARQTCQFEKYVESLGIKKVPPPLPRLCYQISCLKWIPTDDLEATDAMKARRGYYQGAYVVPGTGFFSTVSLKDARGLLNLIQDC